MFTAKMREAAPSAKVTAIGRLPGYGLRFNKRSDDRSGKGNIVPTGNVQDVVWGVIFQIGDHDRAALDRSEGGYERIGIEVLTAGGPLSLSTYVACPDRIDGSLRPYSWYKEFVVRGAAQQGLPDDYIERLRAIVAVADPDAMRDRRMRRILTMP